MDCLPFSYTSADELQVQLPLGKEVRVGERQLMGKHRRCGRHGNGLGLVALGEKLASGSIL
jgi:hypothetical protein